MTTLGEKLRYLRILEGELRGLGREMTQQEVARALRKELGKSISQSYLSQIESGARPHLTKASRALLSKFFKVHPGYLVDDPPGYRTELTPELRSLEGNLDAWLLEGAERFQHDQELSEMLVRLAGHPESRKSLLLLARVLEVPLLAERLLDALATHETEAGSTAGKGGARR